MGININSMTDISILRNGHKNQQLGQSAHLSLTYTHLIDSQVDASIGDDPQHVGDIAFVKGSQAFLLENLFSTVCYTRILACPSEGHACLQNLDRHDTEGRRRTDTTQRGQKEDRHNRGRTESNFIYTKSCMCISVLSEWMCV